MTKNSNIEKLPRKIFVFIIILFFIFLIGTTGFVLVKGLSFKNAIMMTLQSMAFMFTEERGLAKGLQIFLAIFGVMTLGWIISNALNLILEGHFSEYLKTRTTSFNLRNMKNHYIIAGGGRVGEELAKELMQKKKECVIIEKDANKIQALNKKGFLTIHGDVTDSDFSDLIEAGIKKAKAIILAMPETEKNLLMTMTAKELNSSIEVYARADNPAYASKLKKAGAKVVINPETAAAERFIESIE